ncbi:threonine-phosphate decarboxylase CobD [Marinobacter zhanjiangensis]|uniref:threonine-phosphate decarboxylase n=1 Tax=Marinobacter zhanjiangensis TaxID=578215 RepID=A0ABQ3AJJ8_9GAMM|nr:threonine-phosphate decarboxylase CobD [Marinobacter zhanjiangensis]GGY58937.1 threonine-phosphate decarboxylase [Marinobacter zhanjiangensis]
MNRMPTHGGRLIEAARRWGVPLDHWLDLSTGINRRGWTVPPLPARVWRQLPQEDDGLDLVLRETRRAPGSAGCLPVPGSQAAIQALPLLRSPCRVGVPGPGFSEHARCWALAGHQVVMVSPEQVRRGDDWLRSLDVLVWANPNNPTGETVGRERLLDWHSELVGRDGWLVVDEAFAAGYQGLSLVPMSSAPGLVVLQSLGPFFGLAGVRAGAVFAEPAITDALAARLGPWSLSSPARYIMARALKDTIWQQQALEQLRSDSDRLDRLLQGMGLPATTGTLLYRYLAHPDAALMADFLAGRGILVRYFDDPPALRIGLPGDSFEWERLKRTLQHLMNVVDQGRAGC